MSNPFFNPPQFDPDFYPEDDLIFTHPQEYQEWILPIIEDIKEGESYLTPEEIQQLILDRVQNGLDALSPELYEIGYAAFTLAQWLNKEYWKKTVGMNVHAYTRIFLNAITRTFQGFEQFPQFYPGRIPVSLAFTKKFFRYTLDLDLGR